MITYFLEQDLVSFGNYLLSPARREFYIKNGIKEEDVDSILSSVNNIDLTNWVNLVISNQRQPENLTNDSESVPETTSDDEITSPEFEENNSPLSIVR